MLKKSIKTTLLLAAAMCLIAGFPISRQGQSCTIFFATDGSTVLAGSNEDYTNPFSQMWFIPEKEGQYGRVFFGFEDFTIQSGMNDQGLFFDAAAVEGEPVTSDRGGIDFTGSLMEKIMAECASVPEAIEMFNKYKNPNLWNGHYLIGDSQGNSAIIDPWEIILREGNYQIATNFYLSQVDSGGINDERYQIADSLLGNSHSISVDLFREVLSATHFEWGSKTLFSNIWDLKNKLIHVYFFHNYEYVYTVDLQKELLQGEHIERLAPLFPRSFEEERFRNQSEEKFNKYLLGNGFDPELNQLKLDLFVGHYNTPSELGLPKGTESEIIRIDQQLYWKVKMRYNFKLMDLYPASEDTFFHLNRDGSNYFGVKFKIENDQAIQFSIVDSGMEFVFYRM